MGTPAADPKTSALAEELRDYALTLPTTTFPKNFFCAICSQLAFDSWKLLCCNKSICSECHSKLDFPTTCPLCEHSPVEADTCTVNKSLRSTMRAWLQKQKKKEETKNASQPPTPVVSEPAARPESQQPEDSADKPVQSIETVPDREEGTEGQTLAVDGQAVEAEQVAQSGPPQSEEKTTAPAEGETQATDSAAPADAEREGNANAATENTEASPNGEAESGDAAAYGGNTMMNMNGMAGQYGFGFNPGQGNFNGMGFNAMNPMNAMPNMMGGGYMNPMDFNSMNMPNGMYGGFGGNMGMQGMNDMSSMMNFGGGYGNGWQGGLNGGGYGNFNDFNSMGGYNQSGAQYGQMMNQYPKNNFQNQNRFPSNGAAFAQKNNRRGSSGNFGNQNGPGPQQTHSRPESRSGPSKNVRRFHRARKDWSAEIPAPSSQPSLPQPFPQPQSSETDVSVLLQRDGEPPAGSADAAPETKADDDQTDAPAEASQKGKVAGDVSSDHPSSANAEGGQVDDAAEISRAADDNLENRTEQPDLNQIQTVDTSDADASNFDPSMMNAMQFNQGFPPAMMNNFPGMGANMAMNMNTNGAPGPGMGYNQNQKHSHTGAFNAAYGAATVLTGEPRGVGVEGAPKGPRAMREGRPNTGFSARSNPRFNPTIQTPSNAPARDAGVKSPQRRERGTPERDETLRTKDKSPSRSPTGQQKEDERKTRRSRSRSADRESKHRPQARSPTPVAQGDYESRKERRYDRSARYDDPDSRDDRRYDYDDRHQEERGSRGDRTRSTSVESKYRSRRDRDKYKSSRSHRDRSREHRRRHRSRSFDDKYSYEDEETYDNEAPSGSNSKRKYRSEKDKYRERSRDRDRDRDRRDHKDREHEREYENDEKERSKEKDRDRKRSRRERDGDDDRSYEEDKHRSSRRSRRERDRDGDRDYDHRDRESNMAARAVSPPANAPTGPSADGFSIRGFSKTKRADSISTSKSMAPPPTGPRSLQPPKGPAADRSRDRDRRNSRDHKRTSSVTSAATTPTTPTDHYAADRERHTKERVERDNRDKLISSIHGRATGRAGSSSKRSRDETDHDEAQHRDRDYEHDSHSSSKDRDRDRDVSIPTGPSSHRDKRRKSGDNAIANMFTAGLRKQAKGRRGGVKNEGDAERDAERVERERERRW